MVAAAKVIFELRKGDVLVAAFVTEPDNHRVKGDITLLLGGMKLLDFRKDADGTDSPSTIGHRLGEFC